MTIQKFNYDGLLDKLKLEHEQLCNRIDKLEKFLQSKDFKQLEIYHKNLLVLQHVHMCAYCNCLANRILDLQKGEL